MQFLKAKFPALLLAFAMLLSIIPANVFAAIEAPNWEERPDTTENNVWSLPADGDTVAAQTYTAQYKENRTAYEADPKLKAPAGYVRIAFDPTQDGQFPDTDLGVQKAYDVKEGTTWADAVKAGVAVPEAQYKDDTQRFDRWEPTLPADTEKLESNREFVAKYVLTADVVPQLGDERPNVPKNHVRVKFSADKDGSIPEGEISIYWVNPLAKNVQIKAPTVIPNPGYAFSKWSYPIQDSYPSSVNHIAKYVLTADVVAQKPGEAKPNVPENYVSVTFSAGENGTIADGETITYWVNPEQEVTLIAPAVTPNAGYTQKEGSEAWDRSLTGTFAEATTITAQYDKLPFDKNQIEKITITAQPENLAYKEGDKLDLSGLVVTLTDVYGNQQEVPFADFADYGITTDPKNGTGLKMENNQKPVTVSIGSGDTQKEATTDPLKITPVDVPTKPVVGDIKEGDKAVTVTVPTDGDKITVTLPDGSTVTATKDPATGEWKTDDGKVVPEENGQLQMPVDPAKLTADGDVKVTVTDSATGKISTANTKTVQKSEKPDPGVSQTPSVRPIEIGDTEIRGTGVPGAEILITLPDGRAAQTTVRPDGTWSVPIDPAREGDVFEIVQREAGKASSETLRQTAEGKATGRPWLPGGWIPAPPAPGNEEKVEIKHHNAYIFGYPDGTVQPNGNVTRAEAAAMIARLEGLSLDDTTKPAFVDTPGGWYNGVINAVTKAGYMKGYPDGSFNPGGRITRAEFAQMIKTIDTPNAAKAPFEDVKGHWGESAIDQAYGNRRIEGYPDGSFRPNANITRAEAAKILNALYNRWVDDVGLHTELGNPSALRRFADLDPDFWGYYEIVEATNPHDYHKANAANAEIWVEIEN